MLFQNEQEFNTKLIKELSDYLEKDESLIRENRKKNKYNRLYKIKISSLDTINDELVKLREAILHAKNNILHPVVISPKNLSRVLDTIKLTNGKFPYRNTKKEISN